MTKVVINKCFGGFGLSPQATQRYLELKGKKSTIKKDEYGRPAVYLDDGSVYYDNYLDRADPTLDQVVEELGKEASDSFSHLCVVEIGEGVRYRIEEYDGNESIEYADDINWRVG
jgi:hypothetical protein